MSDYETPETPPVEGQEPGAESPSIEEAQLPESPVIEAPDGEEQPPTPEMSVEDKILHKLQSWQGRRDAEMREDLERRERAILERLGSGFNQPQALQQPQPDPTEDADAWFEYKLGQKVQAEQSYNTTLYQSGMQMIEQDPLIKTEPALKNDIVQEIQSGRVQINRSLDPQTAAAVAISMAKSNVLTRRMTQPQNPLGGNTPNPTPKGGIAPPAPKQKAGPKLGKVSPLAKRYAKQWGYSDEEMAKVLGSE